MPISAARPANSTVRRLLTVLGVAGLLLVSGPPAFAKSAITLTADRRTVAVGQTVRFSGSYDDDAGTDGDRVCLYQLIANDPPKPLAPCVPLRDQHGSPLPQYSDHGYFTVTFTARTPGRFVVTPYVDSGALTAYTYARVSITVPGFAAKASRTRAPAAKPTSEPATTPPEATTSTMPAATVPAAAAPSTGSEPPRDLTAAQPPARGGSYVPLLLGSGAVAVVAALLAVAYVRRRRRAG
jgi:hypothetical protein